MTIRSVGPGIPTQPFSGPAAQTPPKTEVPTEKAALESPTNPLDVLLHGDDESFQQLIEGASPAQLKDYMQMLSNDSLAYSSDLARIESQLESNPSPEKRSQLEKQKEDKEAAIQQNNDRIEIIADRL